MTPSSEQGGVIMTLPEGRKSMDDEDTIASGASQALIPIAEREVDFYGDNIPVAQVAGDELFVPLRHLSSSWGLTVVRNVSVSSVTL
jgi:hypothetical protein